MKKIAKRISAAGDIPKLLAGQALLDDMARYARELRANPDLAKQFLRDLGVLAKSGKTRRLIRRPRR